MSQTSGLRYYIYIFNAKVEMLYDQMKHSGIKTVETEFRLQVPWRSCGTNFI